jgi:hypothetical protein
MAGRGLAHAVDADVAGFDECGGAGARFHDTSMPQPFVEALAIQVCALVLAIGGELFLQRRKFCKWGIRIDRPIAIARRSAGRILAMRRAAVALVARATITAVLAVAAIAIPAAFAFAIILAVLATITTEFFASLAVAVAPPLAVLGLGALVTALLGPFNCRVHRGRRAVCRCTVCRCALARLVKRLVAPAMMAMLRPLLAFARFASCGGSDLRALFVLIPVTMAMPLVTGPAFIRAAAWPPDLDQFRRRRRFGKGGGCGRFNRRRDRVCRCFDRS